MDSGLINYGSCIFFKINDSYLTSTGFLNNSLKLSKEDSLKSVFRILPQGIYTVQDTLINASKQEYTKKTCQNFESATPKVPNNSANHPSIIEDEFINSGYLNQNDSSQPVKPISDFERVFNQHKANLEGEISTNINTSLSYKSQPVTFGSQVQLQHWYSKKFLAISNEKHENHRDKLKMYLTEFGGKNSLFYLNSSFRYQEEGSAYIRDNSKVELAIELKSSKKPFYCDQIEDTNEIIANLENKLAFTIKLFNPDSNNITNISCGDFIQLIYSEENSCFTAARNIYDHNIVEPKFSENLKNGNSIWVIEKYFEDINNKSEENKQETRGGKILTGSKYAIKNISTGLYLINETIQETNKLGFGKERKDSKWKFEHAKPEELVESDRFYRIVFCDDDIQGDSEKKNLTLAAEIESNLNIEEKYIPTLIDDEMNISYFRIKKSNDYFLSTTLFLVSCQDFINKFLNELKKSFEKKSFEFTQNFDMLRKCLKEIKHFCLNKLPKLISIDAIEGRIDTLKQNTLRDLKLISTLSGILKFFSDNKINLIIKDQSQVFNKNEFEIVLKKIFSLLRVICKSNQENQEEAFEHIEIYCKYIENVTSSNRFLISLVKNNEKLLYRLASHTCIERRIIVNCYINALKKNSTKNKAELLDFLASLCTYEDEGISTNQDLIHEYLFRNPDNFSRISIPVSSENGFNLDLILPTDENSKEIVIKLEKCCNRFKDRYKDHLFYFSRLLFLYAKICSGKNAINFSSVSIWFPQKLLFFNIWNENISINLRAGFCCLYRSMYIDSFTKIEKKRIETVKVLTIENIFKFNTNRIMKIDINQDFSDVYNFIIKENERKDERKLDSILIEFIKRIETYLDVENNQNIIFDQFLLEILHIIFKMIKLEIIGLSTTNQAGKIIEGPLDEEFIFEETSLFKILKKLIIILFKPRVTSNSEDSKQNESIGKSNLQNKASESLENKEPYKNEGASMEGEHLLNYFKSICSFERKKKDKHTYQDECKIMILNILDYVLDWIIDFHVVTVIEKFKYKSNPENYEKENFDPQSWIPEIFIKNPDKLISDNSNKNEEKFFKRNFYIEKMNFQLLDKNFIENLLIIFSKSNNYMMQNLILSLLMRYFSQRRRMLKAINKLNLITKVQDSNIFNWAKLKILILSDLIEQSNTWFTNSKSLGLDDQILDKSQKMIKILFELGIVLHENSIINDGKIQLSSVDISKEFIRTLDKILQSNSISKFRQNLLVHLNLHTFIAHFIRDHIHKLSEVYDEPKLESESDTKSLLIFIFKICFILLTILVKENSEAQKIIHKYIHIFIRDLRMNLYQMPLIVEIFRNNYELCSKINEKFLNSFISLIETEGRQSRFLDLFPIIQSVNDIVIQENQRMVFKTLVEKPNYKFLLYLNEDGVKFTFECNNNHYNPSYSDQPVLYHVKLLETLTTCVIGSENIYFVGAKCKRIFNIPAIFEALSLSEEKGSELEPLQIPLLKLFYNTYIKSEKGLEETYRNSLFLKYIKTHTNSREKDYLHLEILINILLSYSKKFVNFKRYEYESKEDLITIKEFLNYLNKSNQKNNLNDKNLKALKELSELYNIEMNLTICEIEDPRFDASNFYNTYEFVWEILKKKLIRENNMKIYFSDEKKALLDNIMKINSKDTNFKDFLERIVNYIRQAYTNHSSIRILKNCINFIITLISKDHTNNDTEEKNENLIADILCDLGLVKIILSLMCQRDINTKIYDILVLLSVEMLHGGNSVVQGEFYKFFITSEHSEEFFKKLFLSLNASQISENKETVNYKEESNNLIPVLKVLQLLCENHNSDLQNYLRFQKKSNNSFNIVEAVESLFEKFILDISESSYKVICKCLDILTEMIQGPCKQNQVFLIRSKFLSSAKKLLALKYIDPNIESYSQDSPNPKYLEVYQIARLKYKLSITLLSLLEINKDDEIIAHMFIIDLKELIRMNIEEVYNSCKKNNQTEYTDDIFTYFMRNEKKSQEIKKEKNENFYIIETGFNYYHLFLYLEDYENKINYKTPIKHSTIEYKNENLQKIIKNCWKNIKEAVLIRVRKVFRRNENEEYKNNDYINFFRKYTRRVEINYDSRLILIYFILRPDALFLNNEIKDDFHKNVDRSSEKSKLQYLQIATKNLDLKIKNEQWLIMLLRRYPIASMVIANVYLWSCLSFALTILLNFLLIASYHMPYSEGIQPRLCLSTTRYGECINQASEILTSTVFLILGILHFHFSGFVYLFHALKKGPGLYRDNKELLGRKLPFKIEKITIFLSLLLTSLNPMIFYYFLTCIISLIAVSQKLYGLYCIQMLDIIFRFPSLLNVVKSVYYSRKALFLTFVFNIVIIYYFTLWGYSRLNEEYGKQCPNLAVCMAKTYDQGLKLGMGYVFKPMNPGTYFVERFFFENLFYIVIFTCMMNFIKGIIYDAFFILRDQAEKNERDKQDRCFICGLDKDFIEKNSKISFKDHVENEHNEWNYAFYMMYVTKKKSTELSSIESYVKRHLETNDILWYPQKKGISIISEQKIDNRMTNEIKHIKETIDKLQQEIEIFKGNQLRDSRK